MLHDKEYKSNSINNYIENMENSKTYGGDLEISIFTKIFKCNVAVYQIDQKTKNRYIKIMDFFEDFENNIDKNN
jgi:hypothetical protein